MTSFDHHRSSTHTTGHSTTPIDSGTISSPGIREDEESEYEEIEVEEEMEGEIGVEEDEEDPEEDPEEEEEEGEESNVKDLEEEEEDPEEEDPEEDEEIDDDDHEVEDDVEEEHVLRLEEETSTGAPNASIAVNDDARQDSSPKKHDGCLRSNLSNSIKNLETIAATTSDCEVGDMADDKCSGALKSPSMNVEIHSDNKSSRKDYVLFNNCELEVHTGGDEDVTKTLKIDHINYQEKDCSSPSKSYCAVGIVTDDKSSSPLEKPIRSVEIDSEDKSSKKDRDMPNCCRLEVDAGGDKDLDRSQTLKIPTIDFQEKECSGNIGSTCQLEMQSGGDKDVDPARTLKRSHIDFQQKDCSSEACAKLDMLSDPKGNHFAEKEISAESSFKGGAGSEVNSVPDSMEMDEPSDMQPADVISKAASRFSSPLTRCRSASPNAMGNNRGKKPALICEYFTKGWCIKGSACRFIHKRDNAANTSQMLGEDTALPKRNGGSRELAEALSSQNGSGLITSSRDTTGGVLKQNIMLDIPVASRSSSEVLNFSRHESGPRGFGHSFGSYSGSRLSYHTSMDGATMRPGQYMPNGNNASGLGHYINHNHMADWGSHFSSHSSLRQDAFRSYLVPSSGSGMGRPCHASLSRDSRLSYGYKSKFVPYKWETSNPFRTSSFSVPSLSTSSPEFQYEPIHDSTEKPEEGTSVKASPGVGVLSHGKSHSWNPEKRQSVSDNKAIPIKEAESAAASATGAEAHTNMPKGVERGSNLPCNASRRRIEQKLEKEWQSSDTDLGPTEFAGIHRDSKVLKHFRAALIEFVKELLRPMWHDGTLRKEDFKIIVQKAEEKVVNSLHPNHIPANVEQINQYLSSSQSKILKLLQGYAAKYRKSTSSQSLV